MRINLNCPYEEKDAARALGARWDPGRKTWYIADVEDLTPFMRWISADKKKAPGRKVDHHAPKTTSSSVAVQSCGCDHIPPWEDCEHTEAAAAAALEEILA